MGPSTVESTYTLAEDPVIWFSDGQYHVLYDYPDDRVGYHLTSSDGIHNWTDQGSAYDPRYAQQIFSYTDGTVDHWYKMERPNVVVENGLITHVTFAVSDVDKNDQISAGTDHGSKVIVVPFDGATFDKDTGVGTGGTGGGGGAGGGAGGGGNHGTGGAAGGGAGIGGHGGAGGVSAGASGAGGSSATGGVGGSASGGHGGSGTGGSIGTGGVQGRGGSGSGGSTAGSGGASGSGGTQGTGSGGASATGTGGGPGIDGGTAGEGSTSSGCSCAVGDARVSSHGGPGIWFAVGFALTLIARRPRGARRR